MKKLLILVLVVLVAVGTAFFLRDDAPQEAVTETETTSEFQLSPQNATFTIDGTAVTLSNGKSEDEDEFGASVETTLLNERGAGDLNGDGKDDMVLLLARSGGGSGVFIFAAAYVSGPVSYKGTNAIYIGDRISPQSITIRNGVATFEYLDRSMDEAFSAEPTVEVSKEFVYRNDELQER